MGPVCVCVWWPGSRRRRPPKQPSHRRRGEPIESVVYLTQPPLCPGVAQPKRKARSNDVAQETKPHPPPPALKCAPFFFFFLRVKPSACLTLIPRRLLSSLLFFLQKGSGSFRLLCRWLRRLPTLPPSVAPSCPPAGWPAGRRGRSREIVASSVITYSD